MTAASLTKISLKARRAQPFYAHHPWVFAGAIQQLPDGLSVGQEVLVVSQEGKPIARGLFNPDSQIQVRLYGWDVEQPLNREFWRQRITQAIQWRQLMYSVHRPRDCRLIFSEADGLSGLTVDSFGDWLSVQFTSQAMAIRSDMICDLLEELLEPAGIWLRTEKGMTAAEGLSLSDGLLRGQNPPEDLTIQENGLTYQIDLVSGQKTGFYFDQRQNRLAAAQYLRGRVLDICCYTGGFALNALKHGNTQSVVAVDSSAGALELARRNAALNGFAEQCEFVPSDALKFLEQSDEQFDGIVLDPPKFARSRGGISRAVKAYQKWNLAALRRLQPQGILVTCSCSGLISQQDFLEILASTALEAGKNLKFLEIRGQSSDHPVAASCQENAYLKCVICAVE